MDVPEGLRQRTRDYMRSTRYLVARKTFDDLYDSFSPRLRGDVLSHVSLRTLKHVWCFAGCEDDFLRHLSTLLKPAAYEPGEQIYQAGPSCQGRARFLPLMRWPDLPFGLPSSTVG